ncbi:MAG: ATP-binding cassette domain-containing protein [Spirochaetia bacterium]|nr:ATP-binding cassette domain-containing protein [Spirochaetia bacterium]
MTENNIKLEVNDLSFRYDSRYVLQNISFKVYDKDIVTIIGPNGGGKSTLLKLLLGILKPESGEILINGQNLRKLKKPVLGYVPQYTLFDPKFPISVYETVLSGRLRNGIFKYSSQDREIAHSIIDDIGLSKVKYNTFAALSGGQRQRVLIARALAGNPEILFLDEPTTNIDSNTENYLSDLLQKLHHNLTILLVTHDTAFTTPFQNRVFCINHYFHEHPTQEIRVGMDTVRMVRHDIDINGHSEEDRHYDY